MGAIFYVSSLSQPPVPTGGDKPWHAAAYFGLAVTVARAVVGGLPRRIDLRTAVSAIAIAAAYAVSDELHQMFVPGRFADAKDLVADVTGVLAGTSACWAWGLITSKSQVTRHKAQGTTTHL